METLFALVLHLEGSMFAEIIGYYETSDSCMAAVQSVYEQASNLTALCVPVQLVP